MARIAALVTLFSALTVTPHAESRATHGMGRGNGPCMAVATPAERALMRNESRGWPTADNPRSTAFGCGQLLISQRRRFARACRVHPATTSVAGSMCLMRAYVASRYGSTERALAFRRARGWY